MKKGKERKKGKSKTGRKRREYNNLKIIMIITTMIITIMIIKIINSI